MSKKALKEALKGLDRDQLQDLLLEVYSNIKDAKGYLDFYAEPDEEKKLSEIKEKMYLEFFPLRRRKGKCRFTPCKKRISQFEKMGAASSNILDLMLFLLELGYDATKEYGMNIESFHVSLARNLHTTFEYARKHGLREQFKERLLQQCKNALYWGWGVYDIVCDDISDFCYEIGEDVP